jgi:hypothetical protein
MQNPITPTLPVQSSRAASHDRTPSMSSKARPLRAPMSRKVATMQATRLPRV